MAKREIVGALVDSYGNILELCYFNETMELIKRSEDKVIWDLTDGRHQYFVVSGYDRADINVVNTKSGFRLRAISQNSGSQVELFLPRCN